MFTLFLRHFQTIWWLVYYETIHPKLKSIPCLQTRTFHFPHRASQPPQLLQHFRQMTHVIFYQFSQPQKAIKCVCFPSLQTAHKDYSNRLAKETLSRKKLHFLPLVSNNPKNLAKNRNFSVYLAFWSRVSGTAHLFQMRYTMAAIDGGTTVEVDSSNEMHGDIIRDDSWSQWVFGHLHLLDLFKEEQTTDCLSVLFYKAIHFEGRTKAKENIEHIFFWFAQQCSRFVDDSWPGEAGENSTTHHHPVWFHTWHCLGLWSCWG